jgi:hypothetical protein
MLNLFSTFNTAYLYQGNQQFGQNVATYSPFANQTLIQSAGNSAVVYQLG